MSEQEQAEKRLLAELAASQRALARMEDERNHYASRVAELAPAPSNPSEPSGAGPSEGGWKCPTCGLTWSHRPPSAEQ